MSVPAPETEREHRLRELAGRLLAHPGPDGKTTAELFLAEVPPDTPADLIVPKGLDLLGSLVRRRDGRITGVEVILDGHDAVSDFLIGYDRDLVSHGGRRWERPFREPHGFDAGSAMGPTAIFVNDAAVSGLWIDAREGEGGRTEVGLRYDRENAADMVNMPRPGPVPPDWDVLPELQPPQGLKFESRGSHGGSGRWTSEARAQTEMPVPDMEAHFAKQLIAAGWRRIGGTADETVGWSSWEVPKPGNWQGFLLVLAPFPGRRTLLIRAETVGGRGTGGGWVQA